MKTLQKFAALSLLACAAFSAQAHRAFLLPSSTVLAGATPWITVDAAMASDLFFFDHLPLKLDQLAITAPDGSLVPAENMYSGKLRSSFDLRLAQSGSYKLSLLSEGLQASYQEDGQLKRWRGTAAAFAKDVPAGAAALQVTQRLGRIETFVTNGKPGGKALEITGKGLELAAISHPNDLVAGETASFRLLLDGKPAAQVGVTIVAGGLRYRQQLGEIKAITDADGRFSVAWTTAGLYLLQAEVRDEQHARPPATARIASYVATLEVLPQ